MAKRKTAPEGPERKSAPAGGAEYTVLARRYRPRQFSDLVGQEAIAQALANALESNRVAHAYLFTGARGVGKTSTARILAKCLNCAKGPTITPCDQCDLCQAIAAGEDMDVLEIDGASNRGIDEIREIRQNVAFRPSRARYKIYIIDEVHMLTREAFNALLKTLEEPPPHVKFIFATTDVQKIPLTILSRCQRFDFSGIGLSRIVERLKQIVASEGMQADPEALELIARRAGGSMRDAQSLLDQLLAFGGDQLTLAQIHQLLGTAHEDRVVALAQAILDKNAPACLDVVAQGADQGLQISEWLDQLIDYWRDLMVVASAGLEGQTLSVTSKHRQALAEHAKKLSLDTILAGLDVLVTAKSRLRATSHGRVVLEMALVRLCRLEDLVPLSQLASLLSNEGIAGLNRPAAAVASNTPSSAANEKKKVSSDEEQVFAAHPIPLTEETVAQIWQQILGNVGLTLGMELKKANLPAIFGPNTLVIDPPPGYNHAEKYLDSTRLGRVEEAIRKVTGQAWNVRLGSAAANNQATPASSATTESAVPRQRRHREELRLVPLVAKAMEALGAQVFQLDEDFGAGASPGVAPPPEDASIIATDEET